MARSPSIEMSALSAYPHSMAASPPEASEAFQDDVGQEPSLPADSSPRTHLIPSLQESVKVRDADTLQSHPPQPAQEIRSRQPHRRSLELRYWIWEAINALLLVAMIVAVVVTLRINDGQPAPQWPLSITINALVSIYAFVFKANMAFLLSSCISQFQWSWYRSPRPLGDLALYADAERGPLGSFLWLCSHHFRQPGLTIAAVITIAGIAIDPFFQQLVQSRACVVPLVGGGQPSVPRTNYFGLEILPNTLQPAVISGFYQTQNISDVECATGNCTFDTQYSTLGFCSQCDDVSSGVSIQETCLVENFNGDSFQNTTCDLPSGDASIMSWNITTTSGSFSANFYRQILNMTRDDYGLLYFDSPTVFEVLGGWQNVSVLPYYQIWSEVQQSYPVAVIFPKGDTAIYGVEPADSMQNLTGCTDALTNDTWHCRGYGAANCLLQPCVRTYTASVNAGQAVEVMADRSDPALVWGYSEVAHDEGEVRNGKTFWGLVDKTCINDEERQQLAAAGYDVGDDKRWLGYNITFDPAGMSTNDSATFPGSLLAHKCLYLIDGRFIVSLWNQFLRDALLGNVKRDENANTPNNTNVFTGSQQLLYLFDSGNVNMTTIKSVYDNVAQALTLWIRANGHADFSERAVGEAFEFAICTEVNWPWLALPAALALLTLTTLAVAVATTAWQGLPGWKASPLTFLFHSSAGLDWIDTSLVAPARRREESYDLGTETGMKKFAQRIWVALSYEDENPRLRQVGARTKRF